MKSNKLPRGNALKNFCEIERKFVCLARRHRADYLRLLKQLKASASKNGRRTFLIGACALSLLAVSAQAGVSAPELFNQANAAQREGRFGPAILGYLSCTIALTHRIIDRTKPARWGREKAEVNAPAIPVWQRPVHWLGFDEWTLLGTPLYSWVVPCFSQLAMCRVLTVPWIGASGGAMAFLAAAAIGLRWNELNRAIIQNQQAKAHIAPAANAQGTFKLKAGEIVTAQREYGDFVSYARSINVPVG